MIFARWKSRRKIKDFTRIHTRFEALTWLLYESTFFRAVTLSKCVFWSVSICGIVASRCPSQAQGFVLLSFGDSQLESCRKWKGSNEEEGWWGAWMIAQETIGKTLRKDFLNNAVVWNQHTNPIATLSPQWVSVIGTLSTYTNSLEEGSMRRNTYKAVV